MKANETSGNISATSDDSLFDQPSVAEDTSIADDSILNFTTSVSPFSAKYLRNIVITNKLKLIDLVYQKRFKFPSSLLWYLLEFRLKFHVKSVND